MNHNPGIRYLLFTLFFFASAWATAADKLLVYTVNYPLQYFAARIAGEHAEVYFPTPANVDPAFWMPDAETIASYRQADLVLLNGAGYARWVDKVSLPRARLVDTSAAFAEGYIAETGSVAQSSGGERSHAATAFTTWLDFYQATQQAEAIMQALAKERPQYQAEFERNFRALKQELMALDLDIQKLVASKPAKSLFVSRPVYQYLARRYQLRLESMVWEADEMPDEQQWEQLVYSQEQFPAQWMIWEEQPVAEITQRLRTLGIDVVVFSPCANRPPQGDFLGVMKSNIANLGKVFGANP